MVIALCYSPDWAPHVRIEVHAIQATNPGSKVYLLSDAAGRLDIPGCHFVDVEALFHERCGQDKSITSRFTKYAHYRLLLPEVVSDFRCLYVDADALVDGSLTEFWHRGLLGGAWVAGVRDTGLLPSQVSDIGMGPSEPYINAGVALLDLDKIRDYGVYERWLHDINSRAFSCGDQDVINRACRGNIALVSNEYNSSLSTGFADQPKIMHWAGPADSKPWVNRQARNHHIWQRWANDYAARTEPAAIAVGRLHPDHGSPGHGLSHARR